MATDLSVSINRVRILKTGLANVQNHIDMRKAENRLFFEKIAEPGTELKLRRNKNNDSDPFCVEVYSQDDRYLGKVTAGKNETTARLMDAGLKVIAIVNESLPIHDSDYNYGHAEGAPDDIGWTQNSRTRTNYTDCNLPYCIYLNEEVI